MLGKLADTLRNFGALVDDRRFVFLHVPKTAGSAVKAAIEKSAFAGSFECLPHRASYASLSRAQRSRQTFLTVRMPVDWYLSLYNFKMRSDGGKGYAEMERNSLQDFLVDMVFVENGVEGILRWNRPIEHKRHVVEMAEAYVESGASTRVGFLTVNLLFYGSRDWRRHLGDDSLNAALADGRSGVLDVGHVLRQEFLQADMDGMLAQSGMTISTSERINAMTGNPYRAMLSAETIAEIERRDAGLIDRFYARE